MEKTLSSLCSNLIISCEVIVVLGPNDLESKFVVQSFFSRIPSLKIYNSPIPSLITSLNIGLSKALGEIIVLIDDDVELPKFWLKKIISKFKSDAKMGAYGGRDILKIADAEHLTNVKPAKIVGKFRFDGILIGNHHCGSIFRQSFVDVLKGVNLSFKRSSFPIMTIDTKLIYIGAETCSEVDICLSIKKNGFNILYDNDNYLFHMPAPRQNYDDRLDLFSSTFKKRFFNYGYVMGKYRPIHEIIFYAIRNSLIGSRFSPGFLWSLLLVKKSGPKIFLIPFIMVFNFLIGVSFGVSRRIYF